MRKLAAALALGFTLTSLPLLALAQLNPESSGLTETGNAAFGEQSAAKLNIGIFIGTFIIKPVIGLTGLIFLVLTVYAGIMWMTSAGDTKRVQKAKDILVASVIGAVVIASAYVIVNTVLTALTPGTPSQNVTTPSAS